MSSAPISGRSRTAARPISTARTHPDVLAACRPAAQAPALGCRRWRAAPRAPASPAPSAHRGRRIRAQATRASGSAAAAVVPAAAAAAGSNVAACLAPRRRRQQRQRACRGAGELGRLMQLEGTHVRGLCLNVSPTLLLVRVQAARPRRHAAARREPGPPDGAAHRAVRSAGGTRVLGELESLHRPVPARPLTLLFSPLLCSPLFLQRRQDAQLLLFGDEPHADAVAGVLHEGQPHPPGESKGGSASGGASGAAREPRRLLALLPLSRGLLPPACPPSANARAVRPVGGRERRDVPAPPHVDVV